MAALTVAAIRQRIATDLEAESGWTESGHAPGRFGRDTRQIIHQAFSVEPVSTEPLRPDRQKLGNGAQVSTLLRVRFAYSLRADAQVSDYDGALGAEHTLVRTVLGVSRADLHLVFDSAEARDISDDGAWFLGACRFTAQHLLALS